MIRYNWNVVFRRNKGSSQKILNTIYYLTYRPKVYTKTDKFYYIREVDWSGLSFLKNPKTLFKGRKYHRDIHLAQYIGLASLRSYMEYKALGVLTLDLLAYSGKEDLINNNSLLEIKDGKIHFLYEEATNGEVKPWH